MSFVPLFSIIALVISAVEFACAAPVVIDDTKVRKSIETKIGNLVEAKETVSSKILISQLNRKVANIKLPEMSSLPKEDLYGDCVESVGVIASVYKCSKCPLWHSSGLASAWVLTVDGVMVSNYHVFANKDHAGFGVMLRDGSTYPVTEILAADKDADIAIFRVKADGLTPLPLRTKGKDQKVGQAVHIISHPDGRYFTYTTGYVSRYWKGLRAGKATWMSVTAEFARGSSGGPVLDDCGNVCGMVANTQPIYYGSKGKTGKGPFQMCIRNCVPVYSIHRLISK